jgi:signal transduction histidine kinase
MIAHQWRQPLTRITAITSKISIQSKMNMLEADDLDKSISSINKSVKYMDKTIENFRSFFKPDKEISTVRSINLIHHLEDLLDNVLSKIDVTYNIEDIELNLFENEFLQVLINLIKNSSDVFEEQNIKNPKLIFDLTKIIESDIEYVNIIIKDNGGGIPKDIIDKIFNPYFSTKGKNGTGIGLYMSKSIIEKHHNGTMDVYNENNGAVFNIKVPLNLNKGKNYE